MRSAPPPLLLSLAASVLVAIVLLAHAYIDLGLAIDLPLPGGRVWHADAPVADIAALALLPISLAGALWAGRPLPASPGAWGWALLLVASLLSLHGALDPAAGLHHLVRKPLLVYLMHGIGLSWAIMRLVPSDRVQLLVLAALGITAGVSLTSSSGRILAGDTLWYHSLAGLTPNHKTLAVCLAGWSPLLLSWSLGLPAGRRRTLARVATGLAGAAIFASLSKTAWLGAGLAVATMLPLQRPLAWRPRLILPLLVLGVALAYYSPVLLGSRTMLDAARSRHSLNQRALMMFMDRPLLGQGSGMSTHVEMVTFPHYRTNGVDAHGVIQKVAGETGIVGLTGLGLFVVGVAGRLRTELGDQARRRPDRPTVLLPAYASLATFAVLHGQLLLSTEIFSPTHWVPLATALGLALHPSAAADSSDPETPCAS